MEAQRCILMVEDNDDDVELARRAINRLDSSLEIVVAKDGAEAIDFCCGGSLPSNCFPSIILLDLKLPKYSGEEVLRCLRNQERTKRLPIILVSASKEDISRLQMENVGADGYLSKPLTPADLNGFILKYTQGPSNPLLLGIPSAD